VPIQDASDAGRFVFKQLGNMRADMFMIDTKTGRLWQLVTAGDQTKLMLKPILYSAVNGTIPMPEDTLAATAVEMTRLGKANPDQQGTLEILLRSLAGLKEEVPPKAVTSDPYNLDGIPASPLTPKAK